MKEKNKTIYYIKGLSIFSVICAHCNSVLDKKMDLLMRALYCYRI